MRNTMKRFIKFLIVLLFIGIGAGILMYIFEIPLTDNENNNAKNIEEPKDKIIERPSNDNKSNRQNPEPDKKKSNSQDKSVLENKTICIDPGHQLKGNNAKEPLAPNSTIKKTKCTYGTVGVATKIREEKLNLKVGLLLKERLTNAGAKVIMTRKTSDVDISNVQRAKISNDANSDIFIRLHADGIDNPSVSGISILIPGKEHISDTELLKKSNEIASYVIDAMTEKTKAKNRGIIKRSDISGLNWSKNPAILIEMGFMTNPEEDKKLNDVDYQNKLVSGIVEGLIKYFKSV